MLSPEIFNFKPPLHHFSLLNGSEDTQGKSYNEIKPTLYFNHNVTVVLPDTVLVPEDLNTCLTKDGVFYKVSRLPVNTFISPQFIDAFVKSGQLWALSTDTHIDTDNCAAVTPSGHLILNLLKETYQCLGLEGTQSKFSSERYVVQIDLKKPSFTPGKKNYERTVKCLTQFVNLRMDFLIAWEPPVNVKENNQICPSSVAAYLDEQGWEVSSHTPQVSTSRQYGVQLPPPTTDPPELFEWMGAIALGVNLNRTDAEGRYLSSYSGPLEECRETQVAVLKYSGFFTSVQVDKLLTAFREYVSKRKDLPWAGVHVQGFSDSPVSWGLQEHTFHSDGDNSYTFILQPDGTYTLVKNTTFVKKMKFKTS